MKSVVKGFLSLIVVAIVTSCANSSKSYDSKEGDYLPVNGEVVNDSLLADMDSVADSMEDSMGLNGIRFAHFTDEDWLDNEYIRCLRTYLDDYLRGKIQNEGLDSYKDKMQGGFVIWSCEPFIGGGLFIKFLFINHPDDIFSSWVYSSVDEEAKKVVGYDVRSVNHDDGKSEVTKEDVLRILKEHPENKVW